MFKLMIGAALALCLVALASIGYASALTEEPFLQGYVGALAPVFFGASCFACGYLARLE